MGGRWGGNGRRQAGGEGGLEQLEFFAKPLEMLPFNSYSSLVCPFTTADKIILIVSKLQYLERAIKIDPLLLHYWLEYPAAWRWSQVLVPGGWGEGGRRKLTWLTSSPSPHLPPCVWAPAPWVWPLSPLLLTLPCFSPLLCISQVSFHKSFFTATRPHLHSSLSLSEEQTSFLPGLKSLHFHTLLDNPTFALATPLALLVSNTLGVDLQVAVSQVSYFGRLWTIHKRKIACF